LTRELKTSLASEFYFFISRELEIKTFHTKWRQNAPLSKKKTWALGEKSINAGSVPLVAKVERCPGGGPFFFYDCEAIVEKEKTHLANLCVVSKNSRDCREKNKITSNYLN